MFRYRLLTALIGIPIILGALLWSENAFMVLTMILMVGCMVEFILVIGKIDQKITTRTGLFILGLFYIWAGFLHLFLLRSLSVELTLVVITSTWIYDTSAYGIGIWLGKHKLAPKISPGKSWEGTIGGIAIALLYVMLLSNMDWISLQSSMVLGLVVGVSAFTGDLIESRFKRYANIKDTGKIILGHGGFLDRFDSLMLVAIASFWFIKLAVK